MKRFCVLLLSVSFVMLTLSSCVLMLGGGDPNATGTASVTLDNQSGTTIWYFYISPSSSSSWGSDRLGSHTLSSGSQWTVNGLPSGSWDLKCSSSGKTYNAYRYGVTLSDNTTTTWTIYSLQ